MKAELEKTNSTSTEHDQATQDSRKQKVYAKRDPPVRSKETDLYFLQVLQYEHQDDHQQDQPSGHGCPNCACSGERPGCRPAGLT